MTSKKRSYLLTVVLFLWHDTYTLPKPFRTAALKAALLLIVKTTSCKCTSPRCSFSKRVFFFFFSSALWQSTMLHAIFFSHKMFRFDFVVLSDLNK